MMTIKKNNLKHMHFYVMDEKERELLNYKCVKEMLIRYFLPFYFFSVSHLLNMLKILKC